MQDSGMWGGSMMMKLTKRNNLGISPIKDTHKLKEKSVHWAQTLSCINVSKTRNRTRLHTLGHS